MQRLLLEEIQARAARREKEIEELSPPDHFALLSQREDQRIRAINQPITM